MCGSGAKTSALLPTFCQLMSKHIFDNPVRGIAGNFGNIPWTGAMVFSHRSVQGQSEYWVSLLKIGYLYFDMCWSILEGKRWAKHEAHPDGTDGVAGGLAACSSTSQAKRATSTSETWLTSGRRPSRWSM